MEKLDLVFDVEKLRKELFDVVEKVGEAKIQAKEFLNSQYVGFGGWSITSRTGDHRDGWELGHVVLNQIKELYNQNDEMRFKVMKYLGISNSFEHKNPTQLYTNEIEKVVESFEKLGFYPRRVRLSILKAGKQGDYHRDAPDGHYMVRAHIPLQTNDKCFFILENKSYNMKNDGSVYLVDVSKWHQIKNLSNEDRYHIIMDIWDTKHLTKSMKFCGNIDVLKKEAIEFRKKIDSINLTENDILFFNNIKQKYINKYTG